MRAACRAIALLVVGLALALPARADTIHLTSGALDWMRSAGGASVTMAGGDFTFTGRTGTGVFMPGECNFAPECRGGTTLDLMSRWVGLDLGGTATYEGTTFTGVGGLVADSSLDARWSGSLLIPTDFAGGILTAPFTFAGEFFFPGTPTRPGLLHLFGAGQATLSFAPAAAFPGTFTLESLRFEIGDVAPVPEPASMLLIGTGLAGLAAARRRRRNER